MSRYESIDKILKVSIKFYLTQLVDISLNQRARGEKEMGNCISGDVGGGKQAIGGVQGRPTANNNAGHNDAVDHFFRARGQNPLFTQIELSISASKLRDRDITSKSDPMTILYVKKRDGTLEELGRTEVILNSLNPAWIEKINVAYQFEIVQHLVFRIYDVDTKFQGIPVKALKLNEQEFLGEATCVLSEIVTKRNRSLTLNLHSRNGPGGSRNLGTLTVHAEENFSSRMAVEMKLRCSQLDNKDMFSKSDPFLRISRLLESGNSVPICKTEVINNNLYPVWRPLYLSMQQFGSKDNPLLIECFDFNSNGDHALIGKLQKSVSELEELYKDRSGANLVFPSSRGQEKVLKGQLFVDEFIEKVQFSFLDYISSGFELNFMVAIDFTASNGNPRNPDSLHYIDPSRRLNSYQQAIMEVGEVIQFYDSDRRFPAWGFGGRAYDGTVSHCFNLNGMNAHEVEGVEGIMAAYANALHNVTLAGPTLFGHVINTAAQIAGQTISNDITKYFVLLIITDGVLTDMQETMEALVRASDLPLSILIVGVGDADFKQMEILDADNGHRLESSTGRLATRDIVQFVPMREVYSCRISVVQALLEELPGQFLSYMRSRDIKPVNA
ncbi:Calcium-dependent phospholipid-binding Copine family protein [Theobroma cacao]|uniref:Calcium-dependent phospholipid-binding Copine family protein n=1 Tax=Theobroma cacao TaxID=3641 RepID=A0A061F0N2_THECC|nr:Calcium-dependent phospholipid-binding Copine family protein [Theobroma cacao]